MKTKKLYIEVKVPWSEAQRDEIPENMTLRDFLANLLLGEKPSFEALDVHGQKVIEEIAGALEKRGLFVFEKGDKDYEERIRLIGARNLGRLGGSATSRAKSAAARANGAKGGRPRKSK